VQQSLAVAFDGQKSSAVNDLEKLWSKKFGYERFENKGKAVSGGQPPENRSYPYFFVPYQWLWRCPKKQIVHSRIFLTDRFKNRS